MGTREELHDELLTFMKNVYFQPPSVMKYPCIKYSKIPASKSYANNSTYLRTQGYMLTVIEKEPDSGVSENLEKHFNYCSITNNFVVDELNHTILNLYY